MSRAVAWMLGGLILSVIAGGGVAAAQGVGFDTFAGLKKTALGTLQGKLTWLGPQREMVPSVAFTANGNTVDLGQFAGAQSAGFNYGNDVMPAQTFTASVDELAAMLQKVGALPGITGGGASANGVLSFALAQGGNVFQTVAAPADATALIAAIMAAMPRNQGATQALNDLGCAGNVLGDVTASDVSAGVKVTRSGLRRSRATGRFLQTVTIENQSGGALAGPLSIILEGLAGSIVVMNKAGTTCKITPAGRPYVNLPAGLAAGGRAEVIVEYENPDNLQVAYTTRAFAGEGPR